MTWKNAFLSLEENDSIIDSFGHLGEEPFPTPNVDGDKTLPVMPAKFQSLETFVCMVYAPKYSTQTLPKARWELFRAKKSRERDAATNAWNFNSTYTTGKFPSN